MTLQARTVAIGAVLALLACSGDKGTTGPAASGGMVTAEIDGQPWSSVELQGDSAAFFGGVPTWFVVGGTDSNATRKAYLSITVPAYSGPGTYLIGNAASAAFAAYTVRSPSGTLLQIYQTDDSNHGLIVVSSVDTVGHYAVGTFYFNAANGAAPVQVRNGSFHCHVALR